MTDISDRLVEIAGEAAAIMRQEHTTPASAPDWLQQLLDVEAGDVVNTDTAAQIIKCHADTARSYAVTAAETCQPIGILVAGAVWLFSERRVLDHIEAKSGLPARLAASSRAEKARDFRRRPNLSPQKLIRTEADASKPRAKGAISSS